LEENLLLDKSFKVLKITDFGVSSVFRAPFTSCATKCHGLIGSGPYMAPEEYTESEYDSESVDIWALGIIYFVLSSVSCPWRSASSVDARYAKYLASNNHYQPFDRLAVGPRTVLVIKIVYNV
jgi:protein-serine/threonine kinase